MNDSGETLPAAPAGKLEAFTFGEPTPVLETRGILDYLDCWRNGRYYEPPVDLNGLSRTTKAKPYLQSGLTLKRNMLVRQFFPHALLTRSHFAQLALDFTTYGIGYVERRQALSGRPGRGDEVAPVHARRRMSYYRHTLRGARGRDDDRRAFED